MYAKKVRSLASSLVKRVHYAAGQRVRSELVIDVGEVIPRSSYADIKTSVPGQYDFNYEELRPAARAENPVLRASDVTDYGDVNFVADPFMMLDKKDRFHMFMEVFNSMRTPTGVIGHATSDDGYEWEYDQVVLDTGFHLSYPYVFRHQGDYYMIPEQGRPTGDAALSLFRADPFPNSWSKVTDLLVPDHQTNDHVLFSFDDLYCLLVGDQSEGAVYVYVADSLDGMWSSHPDSPIVRASGDYVRPGGRPLVWEDRVVVPFQQCGPRYGNSLHLFEITELTSEKYQDEKLSTNPVLSGTGGLGWNSGRMHHLDAWATEQGWLCAVDGDVGLGQGYGTGSHWTISIFATA